MQKTISCWKKLGLIGSSLVVASFGGTCLPDNILADTAGEIVNGIFVTGFNMFLAGAGVQM